MSTSILDKLKRKPVPKTKKTVPIFLSSSSQGKPIQIIDKSGDSDEFNREDFLKKIQRVKRVQNKREVGKEDITSSPIVEPVPVPEPTPEPVDT